MAHVVVHCPWQEVTQLHAEVSKHRRTIKKLEEERTGEKAIREGPASRTRPLATKN